VHKFFFFVHEVALIPTSITKGLHEELLLTRSHTFSKQLAIKANVMELVMAYIRRCCTDARRCTPRALHFGKEQDSMPHRTKLEPWLEPWWESWWEPWSGPW
jgi:hypothetical protein